MPVGQAGRVIVNVPVSATSEATSASVRFEFWLATRSTVEGLLTAESVLVHEDGHGHADLTVALQAPVRLRRTRATAANSQRLARARAVPSRAYRKATSESKTCSTPASCSSPTEKPPVRTPRVGMPSLAAA